VGSAFPGGALDRSGTIYKMLPFGHKGLALDTDIMLGSWSSVFFLPIVCSTTAGVKPISEIPTLNLWNARAVPSICFLLSLPFLPSLLLIFLVSHTISGFFFDWGLFYRKFLL